MRIIDRILLASRIVRWRLTWSRRDLDYRPPGELDARFMTAREAARLVPDGACCLSTGMAGNARCSTLFWAIRENFQAEGRTAEPRRALRPPRRRPGRGARLHPERVKLCPRLGRGRARLRNHL